MSNSNRVGEYIPDLLKAYSADVERALAEVLKKDAQQARDELRASSPRQTGKYAKGWSVKEERARFSMVYVVYNKNAPGLPHLLEFGHVIRNGTGRSFGHGGAKPHIAKVEAELNQKVVQDIEKVVQGL